MFSFFLGADCLGGIERDKLSGTNGLLQNSAVSSSSVLLFFGLFEDTKENLKNNKDLSHRANPQKPYKPSRNTQKDQGKSQEEKDQGNKNTKEKKDREVLQKAVASCKNLRL